MRRELLYTATLLSALMLAVGCEQPNTDVLQAEPDYATIVLPTSSVAISKEGGIRTIFVESNRLDIDVQNQSDWVDVNVEQNALSLYVDANELKEERMAIIDVVVGVAPDVAKGRLKVYQAGEGTVDLSAEGTANCYVVRTNSSYYFDASIKGNGDGDGKSNYIAHHGVEIEGGAYATLAWEATYDGDKTRSTKIILDEPIYSPEDKSIYFSTGQSEGNALVAIHNAAGEILWSWHLWVTNDRIGNSRNDTLVWMDRNLGALSNAVGDISNRGMLYQWGRKEPFLPSTREYIYVPSHSYDSEGYLTETEEEFEAIEAAIAEAREKANASNTQVGNGTMEWHLVGEMAPVALTAPGNIEYAVQHPTTVLGCRVDIPIGEYVFDWYLQQDLVGTTGGMQQSGSSLWADRKTIFDPCPVGYRVPPKGAFDELPEGYACTYVTDQWKQTDYGWTWTKGNGDYFPCAGNFDVSGLIGETSEKLLYWTSESFGSGNQGFGKSAQLFTAYGEVFYGIYPILDETDAAAWYSYGARCFAASVRCVRE